MASVHKGFSYLYFLHKTAIRLIESNPGIKAIDLAHKLNIQEKTSAQWLIIYRTEGAFALLSREPGRRKLTSVEINFVRQALKRSPHEFGFKEDHWDTGTVKRFIVQEFDVLYIDSDTLRRTMKKNGLYFERKNKKKEYDSELTELFEIIEKSSPSDYGLDGEWTLDNIYLIARIHVEIPLTKTPLYNRLKEKGWESEYMKKAKAAK